MRLNQYEWDPENDIIAEGAFAKKYKAKKEIIEEQDQGRNILYKDNTQLSIGEIRKFNKDKIINIMSHQRLLQT